MGYGAHERGDRGGWDDLDAMVIEEMEALHARPRERRGDRPLSTAPEDERPTGPHDLGEVPENDEEAFIERTVDYLRERPDAEALLDAVRAALNDEDGDMPFEETRPFEETGPFEEAGEADVAPAADPGPSAAPEAPA